MASTMLQRTQSGTETDSKKATISVWVKLGGSHVGNFNAGIFGTHVSGNYGADGNSQIGFYNGGLYAWFKDGGSTYYKQESTRRFRDHNAWYHLVYRYDMTESTASNRIRVYVNGEEITSWSSTNNPSSTQNIQMNNGGRIVRVGTYNFLNGTNNDFDGCMSHYYFCDGYSYAPTEFGETDSTTGEWKIKTETNVNHGTNGFLILKDGNTITDQSTNSNDLSVGSGTLTKTEDNPSNVFCTMNPLNSVYISFLQGNNTISGGNNGSDYSYIGSTLAANSGKFYWEVKAADLAEIDQVGVALASSSFSQIGLGGGLQNNFGGKSVQFSNGNKAGDSSQSAHMGGFSTDDILMVALDLDNNKITFGRNGQWSNGSGGADQTYANSTAAFTNLTAGEYYMPAHAMRGYGGNTGISRYNFGNGYFATTAVSSAGTNASGNGIFEYDVPTGFTALSTKGLNE